MKNFIILLSIFITSSSYASCYIKANHNEVVMKNCTNKKVNTSFLNFSSEQKQEKANLDPILNIKNVDSIELSIVNSSIKGINWDDTIVSNSTIKQSMLYSPEFIKVRFNQLSLDQVQFTTISRKMGKELKSALSSTSH